MLKCSIIEGKLYSDLQGNVCWDLARPSANGKWRLGLIELR